VKLMPWGDHKAQNPSRFLKPILATLPDGVTERFKTGH
jgi:hypothetical protein